MRASIAFLFAAMLAATNCSAQATQSKCVDRLASVNGAPSDFDRVPSLTYRCVRLTSGKHVLVGQGGSPTAPAVLFIHGLGNNAHRDWRRTLPELMPKFRVVVLDLPGFGASEPLARGYEFDDLDKVLLDVTEQLGLSRFHLVGHSLGAAIALHIAHRHPSWIERLVLVDAAGILLKQVFVRHLLEANASVVGMGSISQVLGALGQEGVTRLIDLLEDQVGLNELLLQNPALRNALFGMEIHADAALGLIEHDFSQAIRSVQAPTVVIWGADDTVTPVRTGKVLAVRMPNARLEILPGAQHMPMNQQPAAFNRALLRALIEAPSPETSAISSTSQGSATCSGQANNRYSGAFDRISLSNCANTVIENARIGELRVEGSSVVLENVIIGPAGLGLRAHSSSITATGAEIAGDVAIQAEDSTLDLAGVSLRGKDRGVDAIRSRVYFSVSEYEAPEYRGTAHFILPGPIPAGSGLP